MTTEQTELLLKPIKKRPLADSVLLPPLPDIFKFLLPLPTPTNDNSSSSSNSNSNNNNSGSSNNKKQKVIRTDIPSPLVADTIIRSHNNPKPQLRPTTIRRSNDRLQHFNSSSDRQDCSNFVRQRVLAMKQKDPSQYYPLSIRSVTCHCNCAPKPCPAFTNCHHLANRYCARCVRVFFLTNSRILLSALRQQSHNVFRWHEDHVVTQTTVLRIFPSPALPPLALNLLNSSSNLANLNSSSNLANISIYPANAKPVITHTTTSMADKLHMYPDIENVAFEFLMLNYWYLQLHCPVCRRDSKCLMSDFYSPADIEQLVKDLNPVTPDATGFDHDELIN